MSKRVDEIAKKLREIQPEISESLINKAAIEMCANYNTIKKYLKGEVKKEAFAIKLLGFFESNVVTA